MYGTLVNIIQVLFTAYWYILMATAVITWIPELTDTQVGQLLSRLTEPYLSLFRKWIRPLPIGAITLDLSYVVGIIVFFLAQQAITSVLYNLLRSMNP